MDLFTLEYEKQLSDKIINIVGKEYSVVFNEKLSLNGDTSRCALLLKDGVVTRLAPTINVTNLKEQNIEIEVAARMIVDALTGDHSMHDDKALDVLDFEKAKPNIRPRLVNTERNEEFLRDKPHINFLNMSIVFAWQCAGADGMMSAYITTRLASHWEKTADDLCVLSFENLQSSSDVVISTLSEVLTHINKNLSSVATDELNEAISNPYDLKMYCVTNKVKLYGASGILLPSILNQLLKIFPNGFVVIPSSVHECLVIDSGVAEAEAINTMIREVNQTQVDACDYLADTAYCYNPKVGKLEIMS